VDLRNNRLGDSSASNVGAEDSAASVPASILTAAPSGQELPLIRAYSNSAAEVREGIDAFAKWVAKGTAAHRSARVQIVVLPELPSWYVQVVSVFASKRQTGKKTPVSGVLHDLLVAATNPAVSAILQPVVGSVTQRFSARGGPSMLDPGDVSALLAIALGARFTDCKAGNAEVPPPARLTSPDLLAPAEGKDDLTLIVHASLSSILWRKRRWGRSRSVGGWMLLDANGLVRAAKLYPG